MVLKHILQLSTLKSLFRPFLLFSLASFISFSAFAQLYSGVITKIDTDGKYILKDRRSGDSFTLNYATNVTSLQVNRLGIGDFISFLGHRDDSKNEVIIETVNYISLSTLLGIWLGDDDSCYYFEGFTKLSVYSANQNGLCDMPMIVAKSKIRKLNYFINPDVANWYMVISDDTSNYAAELLIKNERTIQINLFDEVTGDILSKITLRR